MTARSSSRRAVRMKLVERSRDPWTKTTVGPAPARLSTVSWRKIPVSFELHEVKSFWSTVSFDHDRSR